MSAFSQVSGMFSWLVTKLVTARPDVARCLVVGAPAAVTKYGQVLPAPEDRG
jgi:hypothetical protein